MFIVSSNIDKISKLVVQDMKKIEEKVYDSVGKVISLAEKQIVEKTPIDTGKCRDNWLVDQTNRKEQVIYNPIDYSIFLEYGSSQQAPGGMVRATAAQINNDIKSGAIKI